MSDLTYEDCQYLKKLGMEQDHKLGDWFFANDWGKVTEKTKTLISMENMTWFPAGMEIYKIPYLKELIKFAVELAEKEYGTDTWFQVGIIYNNGADLQDNEFIGTLEFETGGNNFFDKKPKPAVMKLIRYIGVSDE